MPVLEYCSAVWCSAADSHFKLLDRVVRSAGFLAGGILECNLALATLQLDLPSLTPLSVAGCGRLQLGVPHSATSVITASS